ncbi:MAG: phycobiliprotein lyase [Prochloraceae cyanobacterium]|nr:phycobiliprotein lyase [Prochloraceae cyanobacterium]
MTAKEFFQNSAGNWKSKRTTHHLPFRRAETGESDIVVTNLVPEDPKIVEICQLHDIEPSLSVGGAFVSWEASMAWDKEDENHAGTTVFALVPENNNPRAGKLLRERGYAEIVPVIGHYEMDSEDALVLVTEYETMSIYERFWFVNPNLRLRTSTVKRFGGFNTATFCAEIRSEAKEQNLPSSTPEQHFHSIAGW